MGPKMKLATAAREPQSTRLEAVKELESLAQIGQR
jgi:hypothetical protein